MDRQYIQRGSWGSSNPNCLDLRWNNMTEHCKGEKIEEEREKEITDDPQNPA